MPKTNTTNKFHTLAQKIDTSICTMKRVLFGPDESRFGVCVGYGIVVKRLVVRSSMTLCHNTTQIHKRSVSSRIVSKFSFRRSFIVKQSIMLPQDYCVYRAGPCQTHKHKKASIPESLIILLLRIDGIH